jgi:hypothetical protein
MIPLPQTPWTLAIAELMGMRAAAQGSGAQPADLLASVLPNRQPPPEGWLESFLAGTPVPGYAPPTSTTKGSSASVPGPLAAAAGTDSPPDEIAGSQSPLASLTNMASSGSQPVASADSSSAQPENSHSATGWEAAMRILKAGGSKPDVGAAMNALYAPRTQPVVGTSPPQPVRPNPHGGSTPPIVPITRPSSGRPSGPGSRTVGGASGGAGGIEITVQFDLNKLVAEMKLVAETVAHRIVDRQNLIYAAQTRGSMTGRR